MIFLKIWTSGQPKSCWNIVKTYCKILLLGKVQNLYFKILFNVILFWKFLLNFHLKSYYKIEIHPFGNLINFAPLKRKCHIYVLAISLKKLSIILDLSFMTIGMNDSLVAGNSPSSRDIIKNLITTRITLAPNKYLFQKSKETWWNHFSVVEIFTNHLLCEHTSTSKFWLTSTFTSHPHTFFISHKITTSKSSQI